MCGRISQARDVQDYLRGIGMPEDAIFDYMPPPRRFNLSPGTPLEAFQTLAGSPKVDTLKWGYYTPWHEKTKKPPTINATIEKSSSGFWSSLWNEGRVIVAADGWYEWTGPKGDKQPWFIKPKDGAPMFIAALTGRKLELEDQKYGAGVALLTTESAGGMLDVHDRRPIVLTAADARIWMDLSRPKKEMAEFVRNVALPAEAFTWYKVTREVNKAGNQSPAMVEPLVSAS
jgi:putative SOS response-associated peptidase YedK